jgi:hypothetical protein
MDAWGAYDRAVSMTPDEIFQLIVKADERLKYATDERARAPPAGEGLLQQGTTAAAGDWEHALVEQAGSADFPTCRRWKVTRGRASQPASCGEASPSRPPPIPPAVTEYTPDPSRRDRLEQLRADEVEARGVVGRVPAGNPSATSRWYVGRRSGSPS